MTGVRVYGTVHCGYCVRAKQLLERKGIDYEDIDVTGDDAARRKLVEDSGGLRTVPQIWIGDTHVGGYTELAALDREGRLDALVAAAAAPGGAPNP